MSVDSDLIEVFHFMNLAQGAYECVHEHRRHRETIFHE